MDPIYLDHAATTPLREEVVAAMAPFAQATFGNPSSIHRWGRSAFAALEAARAEIASALGAKPSEIFFVRGGTESDNLALLGWCDAQAEGTTPTLAVGALEHHAVLEAAESASRSGRARLVVLRVPTDGRIEPDELRSATAERPTLVSLMWVNNETGMVLPIPEVAEQVRAAGATLHTDAAQALGKVPVDVRTAGIDLLSATGHKLQGPKGTGLLFVREGTRVAPLLHGGGQERALRPGTQDVAGAVGLACAVRLAVEERPTEAVRLTELRERMILALVDRIPGLRINAGGAPRAPHILSVGIPGVKDGNALLMALDLEGVAVSGGSACLSGAAKRSHVMAALYGPDDPFAAVRFSFGRSTRAEEVDRAAEVTARVVTRARAVA
ncbi:MAG: cysteine desulfurase family protein [Longimicrobiales bacterium]